MSAGKSSLSKRIKSLYDDIVNNLFTLREVEVTMVEKGSHIIYTYKKNAVPRKA
ncbi:hypothetical protein [Polluticoccus soli]|uniref:hypothetical protein n=1 Tax=Polluticoccus soli TaxID=3034150 RepID=UPI0023E0BDC3|nr:hypothetical protein [Flavipsychrobacter sp. JY13-12]